MQRRMTNPETTSGDPHEEDNPVPQVSIQDATTRLFATLAAESNWSINDDAGSEDEDVEDVGGKTRASRRTRASRKTRRMTWTRRWAV